MTSPQAVKEALENARIVALSRRESVPDTRPPGESLYNVVVIAAKHELEPNPDFKLSDLPDDPCEAPEFFEAGGQRPFKRKTEETPYERTVFAPDAAEACERAMDVVAWEFGPLDEWWAEAVVPV